MDVEALNPRCLRIAHRSGFLSMKVTEWPLAASAPPVALPTTPDPTIKTSFAIERSSKPHIAIALYGGRDSITGCLELSRRFAPVV